VDLQDEVVQLLKSIVSNTTVSRIDALNARNKGVIIQSYNPETDIAVVKLKELVPYINGLIKNAQDRIEKAFMAKYEIVQIKISDLSEAIRSL
jgi:hypothetical protein